MATMCQLDRLYYLRDVVFPAAERLAKRGGLDFNSYHDPSTGSYCLLGAATMTTGLLRDGWGWMTPLVPEYNKQIGLTAAIDYYDLTKEEALWLFGRGRTESLPAEEELRVRRDFLVRLIDSLEAERFPCEEEVTDDETICHLLADDDLPDDGMGRTGATDACRTTDVSHDGTSGRRDEHAIA